MKTNYRKLMALGLFVLALNVIALAQDFTSKVRVNIPFSFYAGDKELPAGDYTFALNRETSNIAIRGESQSAGAFLMGSPNDSSSGGLVTLTFHSNGNGAYVLEKLQGPDYGLNFAKTKGAAKTVSASANGVASPDTRVVIARLNH